MRTAIVISMLMFGRGLWPGSAVLAGLSAQVFELSAGSSSLYQADGGRFTVRGGSYQGTVGLGTVGGRLVGGAEMTKSTAKATYTLGSAAIPFNLPTDVFDSDHYLTGIGAGVDTTAGKMKVFAFVGGTSRSFNSPFFDGAMFEEPAAVVLLRKKISLEWTESSTVLLSKAVTMLESVEWARVQESGEGMKVALTGGVGANEWYGATSVAVRERRFDLKAAYILAGKDFRRADVQTPLTSEPDRENVLLTVRPTRRFSLSVGRQNYLSPVCASDGQGESTRSSVNQISASAQVAGATFSAMGFDSKFGTRGNVAMSLSANREFSARVRMQATYLASKPTYADGEGGRSMSTWITGVQEVLTPRWSVSQTVNYSNGQSTVGFGGSFLSNLATVSADYQTYYVPARPEAPFQQVLMLNVQVHVLDLLTVNAGTFVAPDGRLLYTTEAEGRMTRHESAAGSGERNTIGVMVLDGRVVNTQGEPVMGAVVLVDQSRVYTNSQGYFLVRERRARVHPLQVLGSDFLDGHAYRVVSAPTVARSGVRDGAPEMLIVVEELSASARLVQ